MIACDQEAVVDSGICSPWHSSVGAGTAAAAGGQGSEHRLDRGRRPGLGGRGFQRSEGVVDAAP